VSASSFLILHGIGNRRPPEHWQFQLAAALAADGSQVLYPQLPEPDAPKFDDWAGEMIEELGRLSGAERTVVCHSLSCLLWMSGMPEFNPDLRPQRVLLVSPPAPDRLPEEGADFRRRLRSGEEIRATARREIRIAASDADPYNPAGAAAFYAEPLGIPFDLVRGAGHITPADGYGPWRSVLDWCRGDADRVRADDA
jgi:uncharacterized protein